MVLTQRNKSKRRFNCTYVTEKSEFRLASVVGHSLVQFQDMSLNIKCYRSFLLFCLLNLRVLFKEIKLTFVIWNSKRNLSLATRHSKRRDPFVVSKWQAEALFLYLEDINRLNIQQTTQGWEFNPYPANVENMVSS